MLNYVCFFLCFTKLFRVIPNVAPRFHAQTMHHAAGTVKPHKNQKMPMRGVPSDPSRAMPSSQADFSKVGAEQRYGYIEEINVFAAPTQC